MRTESDVNGNVNMNKVMQDLESRLLKRKLPEFGPGDTVIVQVKVREGDRERMQAYEGVVIACRNRGHNSSFTVRKVSHGEGVERVFQTHSPVDRGQSRSSAAARSVARSSTTCATVSGKSARIEEKLGRLRTMQVANALWSVVKGIWLALDGLRKVLHLILLLVLFGLLLLAGQTELPYVP